jgi:hypothetical protein
MDDAELETILAAIRPEPAPEFVESVERRLIGVPPRTRRRRRQFGVAVAGIAALAGVLVAVSLVGLNPLSEDAAVDATPTCTTTLATARVMEPMVVTSPDGDVTIARKPTNGTKAVRVCSTPSR